MSSGNTFIYNLQSSPQIKNFSIKSDFCYLHNNQKSQRDLLPSRFRAMSSNNQTEDKRRDLCKNFLLQASKFQSSATYSQWYTRQNLSCSSKSVGFFWPFVRNVIYGVSVPLPLNINKFISVTICPCLAMGEPVNWRYISIVPNIDFTNKFYRD